ncbi:hypothetical protein GCM10023331_06260 [Algivirga pacifica]|uniref:CzcB-like C-terminal circularly permuted SH3-like domain-containing protein n=2 Tax=Algivirga pacifica TaxID=1162670 RepID=A0ABP9D4N2_9BACT
MMVACQPASQHEHDEAGEHGHQHGGAPSTAHTLWTEQVELFVEFPALVVGNVSRFAAHFTQLEGHQPVREGNVTVSLIKGKKGIRQTVDAPSSPGIFTPSLRPQEAGTYQLIFSLKTPTYSERIILNNIVVYASEKEAQKALPAEGENSNTISFLKEQAWKMPFHTVPVLNKEIYKAIPTSGFWIEAPAAYQVLVAPTSGRVHFNEKMLTEGNVVRKGEVIMTVSSESLTTNNLGAEVRKAKAAYELAKSVYDRKKILRESKVVSATDFEKAAQEYQVAKENYETLSNGYTTGGKQVRAPFDGFIKSVSTENGRFTAQGADLLAVSSHENSLLEIRVNPSYNIDLQQIQDLWYQPNPGSWSSLKEKGGKIISVSKEVDSQQPLLSVFAEVEEGIAMPEGSFTEVQIAVGTPEKTTVVPASALLEDYGQYSVMVQTGGESFERRYVVIGKQNGEEVEIVKGLEPNERVVTTGAYQVKMASMSGQAPAHGHAH